MKRQKQEFYNRAFGSIMREHRQQRDLSQTEMARLLGISQSYYNQIEKGERNIDLDIAAQSCELLSIDFNRFVQDSMGLGKKKTTSI